jgi:hypothetical protein
MTGPQKEALGLLRRHNEVFVLRDTVNVLAVLETSPSRPEWCRRIDLNSMGEWCNVRVYRQDKKAKI